MSYVWKLATIFLSSVQTFQQALTTSIPTFLPEHKQQELNTICGMILTIMEPEMIILFGSYARNQWVEDTYVEEGITYEYKSDFDLLVISKVDLGPRRINKWRKLDAQVRAAGFGTPVSLIHHGIKFVNAEIRKNSYFFTDILKEGIVLYNTKNYSLAAPEHLNVKQLQQKAKEDFEQWFKTASMFYEDFQSNFSKGERDKDYYKNAAFMLHQAVERYFTSTLLVFTGYRPKTHDIQKLSEMCTTVNEQFKTVFPSATLYERHCFDLLKRAYIEARYKKDFSVSRDELSFLSSRVELLKELVSKVCAEKVG